MGNAADQAEDRSFIDRYAEQLLVLDARWRAIHRKVWSIRGFLLIPWFFRRVDFAGQAAEASRLSWELADLAKCRETEYPGELKRALDEYYTALKASVELLADVCRLLDSQIYRGDSVAASERNRLTSRYLTVRELTRALRNQVQDLVVERSAD